MQTDILSALPLLVVSKNVFSKLSLIQLIMLKISYVNGVIRDEIDCTIQKRLERFHKNAMRFFAEYISNFLAEQYNILYQQIKSGKWIIHDYGIVLRFGEHTVALKGDVRKNYSTHSKYNPNIYFYVYKSMDKMTPGATLSKKWNDARMSPEMWKQMAKKYILKALMTEYGEVDLSCFIRNLNVQEFMAAYKQYLQRDFSCMMDIVTWKEHGSDLFFHDFYNVRNTEILSGRHLENCVQETQQRKDWMRNEVIPMVTKCKKNAYDITKPFRDPLSLLKKLK